MSPRSAAGPLKFAVFGTVAVLTATLGMPGLAQADDFDGVFAAVAFAQGLRGQLFVPNGPLTDNVLDAGGPAALASLDSVGDSRAYGSFPSPGEDAAAIPGVARGLVNAPVPPDYPLFVSSSYPGAPKQEVGSGAFHLVSESGEASSSAAANSGVGGGDAGAVAVARSQAMTEQVGGRVLSNAVSDISEFQMGPLRIGEVISSARVLLSPDGQLMKTGQTRIVGSEVNGKPVVISGEGVSHGDTPIPGTSPGPIADALTGTGITLQVVPPDDTATGITAPAIRLIKHLDSGESITLTLGLASASISSPSGSVGSPTVGASPEDVGAAVEQAPVANPGSVTGAPATESPAYRAVGDSRPTAAARAARSVLIRRVLFSPGSQRSAGWGFMLLFPVAAVAAVMLLTRKGAKTP
jgi:hypothetical protein